jgi:hypothetical protein
MNPNASAILDKVNLHSTSTGIDFKQSRLQLCEKALNRFAIHLT